MKKMLILAVVVCFAASFFMSSASAQNPKRTVLYTLDPGETILYNEYLVDFSSAGKNYVATIVKKSGREDDYSCSVVLNGERRDYNTTYFAAIGTSSWDDIVYTWDSLDGLYIRFNGLVYGPYDEVDYYNFMDRLNNAFRAVKEGEQLFVKDGKEELDKSATMLFKNPYNFSWDSGTYSTRKGHEYRYTRKEIDRRHVYTLTINGKEFEVDICPVNVNNNRFDVSLNGKHWLLSGDENIYYVDGVKRMFEGDTRSYGDQYIDNEGNYIIKTYKGFVVNGVEMLIPHEDKRYFQTTFGNFAYQKEDGTYVFNGREFVKTDISSLGRDEWPYRYYDHWDDDVTVVSSDRRHMLVHNWESPHVTINEKKFGTAPAIKAEWNEAAKAFFWNALEGQELVVYEYWP